MRFILKSHHFALNRIFFPTNEQVTLKTKQPIRFQGLFKVTNQIERQRVSCGKFCNFCFQDSYFFPPPQKWMNLISNRLSTVSIKYKNWPSPVFGQFQNGCNKVVTEPCVVQFWSEIILVISNSAYDLSQNCTPLSLVTIINTQCGIWIVKARVVLKLFYRLHFVLFFSS